LPEANICFVDESFMALASAKQNFVAALTEQRSAEFVAADCLNDFDANSADCVVCNPPFHQQHTVGDHIAWQMFQQAHKVLRSGGELRVIGNRHLNYHLSLKKLFGNCRQIASNTKFVIYSSQKY
jgi:16S rRNA (guanine1207-N2)-methyltransferase